MLPKTSDDRVNAAVTVYETLCLNGEPAANLQTALINVRAEATRTFSRLTGREAIKFLAALTLEERRVASIALTPTALEKIKQTRVVIGASSKEKPPSPKRGRAPKGEIQLKKWQEDNWKREVAEAKVVCADFINVFERGRDLIYGLSSGRRKYVLALDADYDTHSQIDYANLRVQPNQGFEFVIIDTFNNAFLGTEVMSSVVGGMIAQRQPGHRQLRTDETDASLSYRGKLDGEHQDVKSFREFLEESTSYDWKTISQYSPGNLNCRYGRACKAGMAYAITQRKGRIHFALDDIDWARFFADVDKSHDERQITGKELRWLFRHWDDDRIHNEVLFWSQGRRVVPPWQQQSLAVLWQAYDVKVASKVRDQPSAVKAFTAR